MTIKTTVTGPRKARPTMTAAWTTALALSLLGAGPGTAQEPLQGPAQDASELRALARALTTNPELGAPSQPAPDGGTGATVVPVAPVPGHSEPFPPMAIANTVPSVLDEGAPASGWPASAVDLERMARDTQAANAGDATDPIAAAICEFLARHADEAGADGEALATPLCAPAKE